MEGFVKVSVETKNGETINVGYEAWDVKFYAIKDFNPSQKFLDNMKSGEELLTAMKEWLLDALDNTDYAKNCVKDYGNSSASKLKSLVRDDMHSMKLSSLLDYEEEGYGSEITYNFDTKKKKRKNTGFSY